MRVERVVQTSKFRAQQIAEVLAHAMRNTTYRDYCDVETLCHRVAEVSTNPMYDVFCVYKYTGGAPQIQGIAIGHCGRPWYSLENMYTEEIVVVSDHEQNAMCRARVLKKLHDALESAAEVRGCKDIVIGTSSGHRPAAYIRVLEKRGYSLLGTSMRKEIK